LASQLGQPAGQPDQIRRSGADQVSIRAVIRWVFWAAKIRRWKSFDNVWQVN